jgi:hypothetical protein
MTDYQFLLRVGAPIVAIMVLGFVLLLTGHVAPAFSISIAAPSIVIAANLMLWGRG